MTRRDLARRTRVGAAQINNNGVSWVALTLPYLEQNTVFNAINFQLPSPAACAQPDFATAWYTRLSVLSLPLRRRPGGLPAGWEQRRRRTGPVAITRPRSPRAAARAWSRSSNYGVSFGDNYCIGCIEPRRDFPDGDAVHRSGRPSPDSRASAGPATRAPTPTSTRTSLRLRGRPWHPPRDV